MGTWVLINGTWYKANGVDAEPYMADVMARIQNDWPASRWDELMPWNWSSPADAAVAIAA
jgi:hypothetical protein